MAALLSLVKIFNGNFVASTRLLFGIGKRGLVHPSLWRVDPRFGTPTLAILLMALLTGAAALLGDALLVPVTEVGSLAVGVGWFATCLAFLLRSRAAGRDGAGRDGRLRRLHIGRHHRDESAPNRSRELLAFRMDRLAFWCALGAIFWGTRPRSRRRSELDRS